MQQYTWLKPMMSMVGSLALLRGCATMAAAAPVQRVIFACAGLDETNRFWTLSRPNQLQNDPYLVRLSCLIDML